MHQCTVHVFMTDTAEHYFEIYSHTEVSVLSVNDEENTCCPCIMCPYG